MEFDEEIPEAEAAARSEDLSEIDDDKMDKGYVYDTKSRQVVWDEIATLGVPTRGEIQPIFVNEKIEFHVNHPRPVLCKKSDMAI